MNPTFFANDLLYFEPVRFDKIRKGDIIVFRSPIIRPIIIHRVVRVKEGVILTQGDSNFNQDPFILSSDQIMGRVFAGNRAGKVFAVKSGKAGDLVHHYAMFYRFLLIVLSPIFKNFYDKLSELKITFRFAQRLVKPRLVAIQTKEGTDFQVFIGNHLVAWKEIDNQNWYIRPPYRLIVEPESILQKYENINYSHDIGSDKKIQ